MNTLVVEGSNSPRFCGLCSNTIGKPRINDLRLDETWQNIYRAVYCTGTVSRNGMPRLSGLAYGYRDGQIYVPPKYHQRWDEMGHDGRQQMIAIQDILPPGPLVPDCEKETYAWGFLFHESCWKVLEQACMPQPVNLKTLWRILLSVPHHRDVPYWGHLYSCRHSRYNVFDMPLAPVFILPTLYFCPFEAPELSNLLATTRIAVNTEASRDQEAPSIIPSQSTSTNVSDPFSRLPVELIEMILTFVATEDILPFRLSSRAVATVSLSQGFFRSRFWPDHEFGMLFDAFLLKPADRAGIDWKALYLLSRTRRTKDLATLKERNRLRIWNETVRPLVLAMSQVSRLGGLKGHVDGELDWFQDLKSLYKTSGSFIGSVVFRPLIKHGTTLVHIRLPPRIEAIHVSMITCFGRKHIAGLAFTTECHEDIEIGYTLPGCEEPILVEARLEGFHVTVDDFGIRSIAPYIRQGMPTEYPDWAGEGAGLECQTIRCAGAVRVVRATFDGFRMQLLHVSA
ncbi:hypothetical protein GGS20DRAFT_542913 [Poronia punctata]|nr:hypothetical protein GGS20DRAFT_542913 [Poronia punctata]